MTRVTITFDCPAENADMRAALAGREALAALHEVDECRRRLARGSTERGGGCAARVVGDRGRGVV